MEKQLDIIARTIEEHCQKENGNYSLLTGNMGEILFLYYYSLRNKSYKEKAEILLDQLTESLSTSSYYQFSYCNGLAGFGIGMHLLAEGGFIEDSPDMLDDIDIVLNHYLEQEIQLKHFDFLHGVIGMGFYFLKHYKYKPAASLLQLQKIVKYLEQTAISTPQEDTLKWEIVNWHLPHQAHTKYNISLSHGMSSIAIFLSRLLQLDINPEGKVRKLLEGTLHYILRQRIDEKIYDCYFPSTSLENPGPVNKSRLAWCYGDLGIGIALWHAGKALGRKELTDYAIEFFEFSATRKDLKSNYVWDAGLCHGSAGITQVFFRMWQETRLSSLQSAYEYWKKQTSLFANRPEGPAGYQSYDPTQQSWETKYYILEGVAGIGLTLLSPLHSAWDEILLLNFN